MIYAAKYRNANGDIFNGFVLKWFSNGTALFASAVIDDTSRFGAIYEYKNYPPIIVPNANLIVDPRWLSEQHNETLRHS